MDDLDSLVPGLIAKLGTQGEEDAFHTLIELGSQAIPILMSTFRDEHRPTIRTRLVEIISQSRGPGTIAFLELTLDDSDASVWKAGLDGLVALGGPAVISALRRAQQRELARGDNHTRLEWINEALPQTDQRLTAADVLSRYSDDDESLPEFTQRDLIDVNQIGNFGNRPLNIAATRGLIEEIIALIEGGADVNAPGELDCTPLHDAAGQGHFEAVKVLLQYGASVTNRNQWGYTPIDDALASGRKDIADLMR
jgi:hypothetical protein